MNELSNLDLEGVAAGKAGLGGLPGGSTPSKPKPPTY